MAVEHRGLTVAVWNANGLLPQSVEFRQFLLDERVDICLVSETHLKPGVHVRVPNFSCYRSDRPTAGGGTAVYVRKCFRHHLLHLPALTSVEATAVSVDTARGRVTFVAGYRPPRRVLNVADFEALLSLPGQLFLGGDFNAKHAAWNSRMTNPNGRRLLRIIERHEAVVLGPHQPTIHPFRGQPDVLDIAIAKLLPYHLDVEVRNVLSSDHVPVIYYLDVDPAWVPPRGVTSKKTNWDTYRAQLATELPRIPSADDIGVEETLRLTNSALLDAARTATPPRREDQQCRIRGLPPHLLAAISEKNRVRREWLRTRNPATRRLLNQMQRALRRDLDNHRNRVWADRVAALRVSDGTAWQATKHFLRRSPRMPPLQMGNAVISEPNAKAEALADVFAATFTPVADPVDADHVALVADRLPGFLAAREQDDVIHPVTAPEVRRQIGALITRKAGGADLLSNEMLKQLPPSAADHLAGLFNAVFTTGEFPTAWKHAEVIAVPKPGKDLRSPSSYRPISLLPVMSKLFERLYLRRLLQHIDAEGILPDEQFGFRRGHSTTHQLLRLVEEAMEALDRKEYFGALLLDVSKAFDSVWHEGLLFKLYTLGIPSSHVRLIRSYLQDRTFHVKAGLGVSTRRQIRAGVPQGSVLGPVLYILYTADLPRSPRVELALYADDTALYTKSRSLPLVWRRLQSAVDDIAGWALKWRLSFNAIKSQALIITRRPVPAVLPPVVLRGSPVPWSNTVRYLGVTIDTRLTWRQHISEVRCRGLGRLRELYPVLNTSSSLPPHIGLTIYKSLIRPLLEYAAVVWGNAAATHIRSLQRLQNRALRAALHLPRDYPSRQLHDLAGVQFLEDRFRATARAFYEKTARSRNDRIRALGQRLHWRPGTRWPDLLRN